MTLSQIQFIFLIVTTIVLFLYGLENFSREIHQLGATRFQSTLTRITSNRFFGFFLGAGVTAVIQSSSAVTALTIALVNSKALTLLQSLPIMLGANVGTTLTAQLVAFKLTGIGPIFIVLGFLMSVIKMRYSIFGKTVFYFGFIFFSLDLISNALLPLRENPQIQTLLATPLHPLLSLATGALVTGIVQSSSVTTGLTILLVQQGHLTTQNAIPIVLGANIGTTVTGLLACIKMDRIAKRTAIANSIANLSGALAFMLFLPEFTELVHRTAYRPGMIVAHAHLFFNLSISVFFLLLLTPLARGVELILPAATRPSAS